MQLFSILSTTSRLEEGVLSQDSLAPTPTEMCRIAMLLVIIFSTGCFEQSSSEFEVEPIPYVVERNYVIGCEIVGYKSATPHIGRDLGSFRGGHCFTQVGDSLVVSGFLKNFNGLRGFYVVKNVVVTLCGMELKRVATDELRLETVEGTKCEAVKGDTLMFDPL